jgi:hypothetical protein
MTEKKRPKLRPSVKKAWLEALRNNDYKQGTGMLRNPESASFCCLGVLCNLHAQANPKYAASQTSPYEYGGNSCLPPKEVLEWAFGSVADKREEALWDSEIAGDTLYGLNDTGYTFKQIANVIEKEF